MSLSAPKKGKEFWGEPVWTSIHSFAAVYKPEHAASFKAFINSLVYLLPCEACRQHLSQHLKRIPMDKYLSNNHDLFYWTYILHDAVNQEINKHASRGSPLKQSPPYDEVKNKYFKALSDYCSECKAV